MNTPYTKIIHGWVEQNYDETGRCVGQWFVPIEAQPPERRDTDTDELIEDEAEIAKIESAEKYQGTDMIQP
jgi:hypothetical protein